MSNSETLIETGFELYQKLLSEKSKLISEKLILDKKDKHNYPITNSPFNIPSNWYWCYLSDISIIQEGPGIRKHQYQESGIQFLTVTNILEDNIDLEKSKKYISLVEYEKTYRHFTINKGDIVTACSGGSWGKSAIFQLNDQLILNTSTLRLRFFNDLGSNRYLYYLTKTNYFKNSLRSYITGQQPNYGYSHYSKIPIPLPSYTEQQRIVSILNTAFEAIDKAKANAEQNLKNSKELFESYLQNVFSTKGEGWEEKALGNIVDFFNGFAFKSKDVIETSNTQLIRMGNLYQNQLNLDRRAVFYPDDFALTHKKYLLEENDLIISLTGTTDKEDYGYTVRIPENKYNLLLNQRIAKIKIKNEEKTNKDYLLHFLLSRTFLDKLYKTANGTRQANLSTETMKNLSITIPDLKEQQIIVQKLDFLSKEIKKLEAIYQQKMIDLEELKKSLLEKAFKGELKSEKMVVV